MKKRKDKIKNRLNKSSFIKSLLKNRSKLSQSNSIRSLLKNRGKSSFIKSLLKNRSKLSQSNSIRSLLKNRGKSSLFRAIPKKTTKKIKDICANLQAKKGFEKYNTMEMLSAETNLSAIALPSPFFTPLWNSKNCLGLLFALHDDPIIVPSSPRISNSRNQLDLFL